MNLYVNDIIEKCHGNLIIGNKNTLLTNFTIDSRIVHKNDIYVGIKGENNDGGTFYKDALKKGAKGCILNDNIKLDNDLNNYPNIFIIIVKDTIKCLQDLAIYKRSLYDIPFIGITGSVGKTSTKDLVASVLSQKYKVLKTKKSYNSLIGLPLTILSLKDEEVAVVEIGMNHLREIAFKSKIVKPNIAIITNIGTSHIGYLKSRENILKAKLEILEGMDNKGILIINNDNDLLHKYYEKNKRENIITLGIKNQSDYQAFNIKESELYSTFSTLINKNNYEFKINVPGINYIYNSLNAIIIGNLFSLNIEDIKKGIAKFSLTQNRMDIEKINNITIINECYNASLESTSSALTYLGSLSNRKIAILGDMLELGNFSKSLHEKVAESIFNNKIDKVILVGNDSLYIKNKLISLGYNSQNIYHYLNNNDALNKIKQIIKVKDSLLIKASLGMNFIEIVNGLKRYLK